MKQLEVFNKIGGIIKELNDQYKYIEANPENLNDLELELFVANAHFLADHAEILSKLSQRAKADKVAEPERLVEPEKPAEPKKVVEQKVITTEKFFEPVVQQPKRDQKHEMELDTTAIKTNEPIAHIDLSTDTPKDTYSFIKEEPEVIRHELVVDETDDDLEEEIIEDKILAADEAEKPGEVIAIEETEVPLKEEVKPIIRKNEVVKDKEEVITINQKISSQLSGKNNITEHAGAQPVTNLKQAITLNDKLLYIKDLFNGYSLAYSEAIEILNRFNTFEEANRFLNKNYTVKNNWDSKPDTAEKFFALLKRRYS